MSRKRRHSQCDRSDRSKIMSKKQKRMTIIIAGDRGQAQRYAFDHALFEDEWRYVNDIDKVRGMVDFDIVYTGQYFLNPVYSSTRSKDELEMRSKMKR